MTPTVGRIVHFYTRNKSQHFNGGGEGPYAAMVVQTWGGPFVNLKVFPSMGAPYDQGSVKEKGAEENQTMWWEWPPRD